jgi:hypothetical protein
MIYSDRTFSQKLERTEARANADFVETRKRLIPDSGATWIEVGGAYAMFDGVGSPLTQTFGLGVFEDATAEHLDELEVFFKERGAEVFHEVSPMADQSLMALLSERGYRPMELTSVMYRELFESRLQAAIRRRRPPKGGTQNGGTQNAYVDGPMPISGPRLRPPVGPQSTRVSLNTSARSARSLRGQAVAISSSPNSTALRSPPEDCRSMTTSAFSPVRPQFAKHDVRALKTLCCVLASSSRWSKAANLP